jgi:hypothetical protein
MRSVIADSMCYQLCTTRSEPFNYHSPLTSAKIRGLKGIKKANISLPPPSEKLEEATPAEQLPFPSGGELRVAVVNGIANARKLLQSFREGKAPTLDFVEVRGTARARNRCIPAVGCLKLRCAALGCWCFTGNPELSFGGNPETAPPCLQRGRSTSFKQAPHALTRSGPARLLATRPPSDAGRAFR